MSIKKRLSRNKDPGNLIIAPIAFIIAVIPMIVFLKVVTLTPVEIKNWYGEASYADFFTYYKSQWLLAFTVMAAVFFLIYFLIKGLKLEKKIFYIPTAIYAALIILSTAASKNPRIALKGFVARYEGMWTLLCYLALMAITYNLVKTESQIRFLMGTLLASAAIIGLIGMLQFLGYDLFRSDFGRRLILPEVYHQIADKLNFRFEESMVFSTLNNPNYVGSYMVLIIPIAFSAFLYINKPYMKILIGFILVAMLISLFGSRSRAGLAGFVLSVLLALVIFRKSIFKKKILSLIIVGGLAILFFGANFALSGAITQRVLTEFKESAGNQLFDLKDIYFKDNTVSITSGTEILTIRINQSSQLSFLNTGSNELHYVMEGNEGNFNIKFSDVGYKDYKINVQGDLVTVSQNHSQLQLKSYENSTFKFIGINGDETNAIQKPESIGFVGNERLGSARGYIWSRTLPMLKNALFIGYGPDTFAIEFPQNDYIGKIRAYGKAQMIVDKPHNMYLQMGVNTGVLSLAAFIVLLGIYLAQSMKTCFKHMDMSLLSLLGAGIFIAVCAYLTAAFFNDSVVGVAPVFWVLLGLGFLCNSKTGQIKG